MLFTRPNATFPLHVSASLSLSLQRVVVIYRILSYYVEMHHMSMHGTPGIHLKHPPICGQMKNHLDTQSFIESVNMVIVIVIYVVQSFLGNIWSYLHYLSFDNTEMVHVAEILPHIDNDIFILKPWVLMAWWLKGSGHQQPYYWHCSGGIFLFQHHHILLDMSMT